MILLFLHARMLFEYKRVHSSVVERCPDKTEVVGPIPTAPTKIIYFLKAKRKFAYKLKKIKNNYIIIDIRAVSSDRLERHIDIVKVTGSSPVSPTKNHTFRYFLSCAEVSVSRHTKLNARTIKHSFPCFLLPSRPRFGKRFF